MGGVKAAPETPLERAIRLADGMTALARKLNERGHEIKGHATIYQWKQGRVPADYCPDIEALTGVTCEELRPDVSWSVLRDTKPARLITQQAQQPQPPQDDDLTTSIDPSCKG